LRRSQNARADLIEYNAISTVAFNNDSGGTLRRPLAEYMPSNTSSIDVSTVSTTARMRRIGWSTGIKSSVDNVESIAI
jgi:hypothetical protein